MSNATRRIRRHHARNQADIRAAEVRRVVNAATATQLHDKLVKDAVNGHPTDLQFTVLAYERIAKLRRQPLDDAFKAVVAEVEQARGGLSMPL